MISHDDDSHVDVDDNDDDDCGNSTVGGVDSVDADDRTFEAPSKDTCVEYLTDLWNIFNLPINREGIVNEYFGAIFCDRKNNEHLYVGKAEEIYINVEQGVVSAIQLNCLRKKHVTLNNILEEYSKHLSSDIDIFPFWNIITRP